MNISKISEAVERHSKEILAVERFIWNHPETGYKELVTSEYMAKAFEALGYKITRAEGITGFYTVIDTGRPGPEVMILGELDSIICPSHPESDKETGAVHSCGHNAQCAALYGIAAALKEDGMLDGLSGSIRLVAVPAEELLEIEFRSEMRKNGRIRYFGGKTEFLHRGYFDGVDLAFMVHTSRSFSVNRGSVGFIAKQVAYKGKASHAGGAPQKGRNALYAANAGLNAINAIRETFTEEDLIRVHPIITEGGSMVNAIPETVKIESYVRGKTFTAIKDANAKVNRALVGAALSLGTNIEIVDMPGYSPLNNDAELIEIAREAAELMIPEEGFKVNDQYSRGSTDMGDLSCVMPVIHPYARGGCGTSHGNDYCIEDPVCACVKNAKWQIAMLTLLLQDGGARAREIVDSYTPTFSSKAEYLAYIDELYDEGDRINYIDENNATVRFS